MAWLEALNFSATELSSWMTRLTSRTTASPTSPLVPFTAGTWFAVCEIWPAPQAVRASAAEPATRASAPRAAGDFRCFTVFSSIEAYVVLQSASRIAPADHGYLLSTPLKQPWRGREGGARW